MGNVKPEGCISRNGIAGLVAVLLILGWCSAVGAAPKAPLENLLRADKVTTSPEGKETLAAAKKVTPGDVIQYRLDQKNVGKDVLKDVTAVGPIPKGTRYVGGSARTETPCNFKVSIDNGTTWSAEPVTRAIKDASGKMVEQTVPPAEYTHLQWVVKEPMPKDAKRSFLYRVRVNEP